MHINSGIHNNNLGRNLSYGNSNIFTFSRFKLVIAIKWNSNDGSTDTYASKCTVIINTNNTHITGCEIQLTSIIRCNANARINLIINLHINSVIANKNLSRNLTYSYIDDFTFSSFKFVIAIKWNSNIGTTYTYSSKCTFIINNNHVLITGCEIQLTSIRRQ